MLRPAVLKTFWSELDTQRAATFGSLQLRVIDLRPSAERQPQTPVAQLGAALERISAANQGFGELVADHLRRIVIAPSPGIVASRTPAYWETANAIAHADPLELASILVYVATWVRLRRDARAFRRRLRIPALRQASWAAQTRFLECFPDGSWWIDRLRPRWSAV